jgi:hypothetical protein
MRGEEDCCYRCAYYLNGTCRINPPVIYPSLTSYQPGPMLAWVDNKQVSHLPAMQYTLSGISGWPTVGVGEWCGQFKAKPYQLPKPECRHLDLEGKTNEEV